MSRHDPSLIEAFETNRAAIAAASETNADKVKRLRRDCETEKNIRQRAVIDEVLNAGGTIRDAWDNGVEATKVIDREYADLIRPLLPKVVTSDLPETRDPVFEPGNASLRYWGRG